MVGHSPVSQSLFSFYAPNFEEGEGVYWLGPVRLWLGASIRYAYVRSRTLDMWNKHEK